MTRYEQVEAAIGYISRNFRTQPDLGDVASFVHMSPFHLQRVFREWAGVSPKKFLQYISIGYAKELLKKNYPVAEATYETGFSGTGRLHDLFVTIEGMTPGAYRTGARDITIRYDFYDTPFGRAAVASTGRAICFLSFTDNEKEARARLVDEYPQAALIRAKDTVQKNAIRIFAPARTKMIPISIVLKGTPFQIKVWEALMKIPEGAVTTYAGIARMIGHPHAVRAVGSAVGKNPVPYIIPCHRVIRSTGYFGEYGGGKSKKLAMLGWEAAQTNR